MCSLPTCRMSSQAQRVCSWCMSHRLNLVFCNLWDTTVAHLLQSTHISFSNQYITLCSQIIFNIANGYIWQKEEKGKKRNHTINDNLINTETQSIDWFVNEIFILFLWIIIERDPLMIGFILNLDKLFGYPSLTPYLY